MFSQRPHVLFSPDRFAVNDICLQRCVYCQFLQSMRISIIQVQVQVYLIYHTLACEQALLSRMGRRGKREKSEEKERVTALSTSQKITGNEQAEMRTLAKKHSKSVRQRSVRQDNTMNRADTFPLNLYETETVLKPVRPAILNYR